MTELELKVCQIVREIAGITDDGAITLAIRVNDLNIDSLETFALQMDLNNAFNVEIPIEKFSLCENIDSICHAIEDEQS